MKINNFLFTDWDINVAQLISVSRGFWANLIVQKKIKKKFWDISI